MKGQVINGIYYSWRKPEHIMRRWHSFGISIEILNNLREAGIEKIRFPFGDKVYESTVTQFLLSDKTYDNDGDIQKHMPLSRMEPVSPAGMLESFV